MKHVREMTQDNLRKMQLVELDLLLELDRICRKYKIKYMLIGGSLLGAIRHKGFIPWDDDIDVGMLRSEYKKFIVACQKELNKDKYFLQDFESDKEYRWGYSKLINLKTIYERTGQDNLKMKKCMFIDIFVLDGVPNSRFGYQIHRGICFCIRKVLWSPVGKNVSKNLWIRNWYRFLSLIPRNISILAIKLLSAMFSEEKSEGFRYLTFPIHGPLKREWIIEQKEIEFESHMIYIPVGAHDILTQEFGDYMTPPPEKERMGHNTASYYRFEGEKDL